MVAQTFWRMFPRQIASDLCRFFPGYRIADWHHGRMSSYELLELFGVCVEDDPDTRTRSISVDFAPEDGAVAKAMRGGRWSERELIVAETFNELARLRASYHSVNGGRSHSYEPHEFEDPTVREAKVNLAAVNAKLQADVEADIFGSWSGEE